MKNVKTTTIKIRHRSLALLLLILIAFSNASCNVEDIVLDLIGNTNESTSALNTEDLSEDSDVSTEPPTEDVTEPEVIIPYNKEIEAEIQEKYWHQYIGSKPDYAEIPYEWTTPPKVQYYGQFGNAYMVYLWCDETTGRIGAYFVEGYEFRYEGERQILAYKNGIFYTLEESLEHNFIDLKDLEAIHSEFKELNSSNYKQIYMRPPVDDYEVIPGEIEIRIQPEYNSKEYDIEDFSDIGCTKLEYGPSEELESHLIYRYFRLYLPAETEEEVVKAIRVLEAREDIYSAIPIVPFKLDALPNDSEYGSLSSDNYWAINKISLPQAWDEITGKSAILVGVIDSGIDNTHPDLQGRVNTSLSKCFVDGCGCTNGLTDNTGMELR